MGTIYRPYPLTTDGCLARCVVRTVDIVRHHHPRQIANVLIAHVVVRAQYGWTVWSRRLLTDDGLGIYLRTEIPFSDIGALKGLCACVCVCKAFCLYFLRDDGFFACNSTVLLLLLLILLLPVIIEDRLPSHQRTHVHAYIRTEIWDDAATLKCRLCVVCFGRSIVRVGVLLGSRWCAQPPHSNRTDSTMTLPPTLCLFPRSPFSTLTR